MDVFEVGIRKLNSIVVPSRVVKVSKTHLSESEKDTLAVWNKTIVLTLNAELMNIGYVMSESAFNALCRLDNFEIVNMSKYLIDIVRRLKGDDVTYRPMYPNFPQQVMDMSEAELYLNAILHYWSKGTWQPSQHKLSRTFEMENIKFIELGVASHQDVLDIFEQLMSSNDSISQTDKDIVWFLYTNYSQTITVPEKIPFRENMCLLAGMVITNNFYEKSSIVSSIDPLIQTTTDMLRLITYLSDGDISLGENTKFKSLPRRVRKHLIARLEEVANLEDFNRHKNKWIRALHSLHVGDYSQKLFNMAKILRENEHVETFASKVELELNHGKVAGVCQLLKQRPGDFARRLDHVLRICDNQRDMRCVVDEFLHVAGNVPTKNLLQLKAALSSRVGTTRDVPRVAFPKGSTQHAILIPSHDKDLPASIVSSICSTIDEELQSRFSQQDPLGITYVDPALKGCPVPSQMRSVSEGAFQVARGTRLPIGEDSTLRFFIYWVGRDIDLSASFHDGNFKQTTYVSYTNLRDSDIGACHSGDIINAPNGACEFIDIDINKALRAGHSFVVMNVYVYSGPVFKNHDKVYAGWMTRDKPNSNELFDPKTVVQKVDLTGESRVCIPVVFDLVNRQAIITDLNSTGRQFTWGRGNHWGINTGGNNVEQNRATTENVLQAITSLDNKPNLYDLFMLHAKSRGTVVEDKTMAETVFGLEHFDGSENSITPYDVMKINSEYVA